MNAMNTTTDNTTHSSMTYSPKTVGKLLTQTIGYRLTHITHIESNMAVLDAAQQQLIEAANELSALPIPESVE